MAGESDKKQDNDAGEAAADGGGKNENRKNKKKGLLARIWNSVFRLHGDDFEKRLQHISKEEATVHSRMKRRAVSWRRTARNIIIFSIILELVAVGYAIMTTRTVDLNWKMRALRVLPMFLLPGLSSALYSGLVSFTRMCDRKDQKTLERLRAERQAKIDELKERTNYYTTQQLIQRYDSDPAAKAAAATVLASKLGADSGLKVFLGDEPTLNELSMGKSSDVELVQAGGLRRRNQSDARPMESNAPHLSDKETIQYAGHEASENSRQSQLVVEHRNPTTSNMDGGWIARIAALLVGEDPTQSYALICGNCHMHNGLARKEDFPFITYYCPHCNALNRPKHLEERSSGTGTPELTSSITMLAEVNLPNNPSASISERASASSTPLAAISTPLASSSSPLAASSSPLAAAAKEQDTSEGLLSEVPPS